MASKQEILAALASLQSQLEDFNNHVRKYTSRFQEAYSLQQSNTYFQCPQSLPPLPPPPPYPLEDAPYTQNFQKPPLSILSLHTSLHYPCLDPSPPTFKLYHPSPSTPPLLPTVYPLVQESHLSSLHSMDMDHPTVHVFGSVVAPMVDDGDSGKIDRKGDPPSDTDKASIVTCGSKGEQEALEAALESTRKSTAVSFDEIHIFNKAHQDSFYPSIKNGTVVFVDATIVNSCFHHITTFLSRVPADARRGFLSALSINILSTMEIAHAENTHRSLNILSISYLPSIEPEPPPKEPPPKEPPPPSIALPRKHHLSRPGFRKETNAIIIVLGWGLSFIYVTDDMASI